MIFNSIKCVIWVSSLSPHACSYELMFSRLIKHTDDDHPDQKPLQEALKLVHDILLHLNCKEREALENDQRESALRELEVTVQYTFFYTDNIHPSYNRVASKFRRAQFQLGRVNFAPMKKCFINLMFIFTGCHWRYFGSCVERSAVFTVRFGFDATWSRW